MTTRVVLTVTLFCSSFALAQMGPGGPGPRGHRPGGPAAFGFHSGKVVTGAPYSATVTNTSVRTLADGNTIQRTTTGTVARDNEGRTYTSETVTGMFGQAGTKTMTFIADPVAGYVYTLNAETKTAMRRALHTPGGKEGFEGRANGTRPANPNVVAVDKGTQMVNGVNAQGKEMTRTIPAGTMGNEKPIVSKTETWYSPDLQVVIASTRTDPGEGTSSYALTNISRTEPAASMFQVPSDYTIKDARSFGERGH